MGLCVCHERQWMRLVVNMGSSFPGPWRVTLSAWGARATPCIHTCTSAPELGEKSLQGEHISSLNPHVLVDWGWDSTWAEQSVLSPLPRSHCSQQGLLGLGWAWLPHLSRV